MLPILNILAPIVDKALSFIPDPQKKAEVQLALQKEINDHEEKILAALSAVDTAQLAVNAEEAKSESLFKSGWRPAVAWVCVVGFAWATVVQPVVVFGMAAYGRAFVPPAIETAILMQALFGLLGLGALRTYEKKLGVAGK